MDKYVNRIPMSFWAEDDKPVSKLNIKASGALSDAEHLAILIGNANDDK
jgi:hypothetical protein